MTIYDAEQDPACYPGGSVLRNKLDIIQQADLDEAETALVISRATEKWPSGQLNYDHYKSLHHHLFQDVYDWAGQSRLIRTGKDGNWFCYPEYIDVHMERIFSDLEEHDNLWGLSPIEFARQTAHFLAEINAVHPFREGNGRVQMAFLQLLCSNAGYVFNDDVLDQESVIQAMKLSFSGDERPLKHLIRDLIR